PSSPSCFRNWTQTGFGLSGVRSYRKETNLRRRLGQGSDWHSKQRDGEDDSSSSSRYQEGSPVHDSSTERTGGTARRYGVRRRASSNDPGTATIRGHERSAVPFDETNSWVKSG